MIEGYIFTVGGKQLQLITNQNPSTVHVLSDQKKKMYYLILSPSNITKRKHITEKYKGQECDITSQHYYLETHTYLLISVFVTFE